MVHSFIEFIAKCFVCSDVPEGEWLCPRCVAHAKKPSLTRTLSQQKVTDRHKIMIFILKFSIS